VTVQLGKDDEVNLAPLFGMLILNWSPLLCGSVAGSPASVFVSDQEPLVVTVSRPKKLSVQPLKAAGGLLVTVAVRLGELARGVFAVSFTLVHVTVMENPLIVPLSVTFPLLVTLNEVFDGVRVSPASASAGVAARTITAAVPAASEAIRTRVRKFMLRSLCVNGTMPARLRPVPAVLLGPFLSGFLPVP
jgi:hypothetical protein